MFRRAYRGYELIISSWILSQLLLAVILSWWAKWLRCNFSDTQTNLESKKNRRLFSQSWMINVFHIQWMIFLFCFVYFTGKSFSEALILPSTNPQFDKRSFIELWVQYMKTTSSEHVVYINCSECRNKKQNNLCTQHVLNFHVKNL